MPTQHQNNARTGANLEESILNTSNVGLGTFGKTSARPVRGSVYAQPLYIPSVAVADDQRRDVVLVATMRNYVYAFDAKDPTRPPYWTRQLDAPVPLPDDEIDARYPDVWDEIGVLGTPVVDIAENAMYVVTASKDGASYRHVLHKLSVTNGRDLVLPVAIGDSSFRSAKQAQRSALLFEDGVVYVAFGKYGATQRAFGRMFAYDQTLGAIADLATASEDEGAWIWMGGQGPASDGAGRVYVATDRASDGATGARASRLLALGMTSSSLDIAASYVPTSSSSSTPEGALGSSGPLVLPGSKRVVVAGTRRLYVLGPNAADGDALDLHQHFRTSAVVLPGCDTIACNRIFGSPVFWEGPRHSQLYVWAAEDVLRAFRFDPGAQIVDCGAATPPDCHPASQSTPRDSSDESGAPPPMPGGMLSISANGKDANTGIVWATHAYTASYDLEMPDGVLRAYDAEDVSRQLYSSAAKPRDELGPMSKLVAPVVSGGQVFVPTMAGLTHRTTFWENRSSWGPALASIGDGALVLAWMSDDPALGLRLVWSHDGMRFDATNQSRLTTFSQFEPALVSDGSKLFMAYGGFPPARVTNPSEMTQVRAGVFADATLSALRPLVQARGGGEILGRTNSGPALAYGHGKVFLAWKDAETNDIHVLVSSDGATFDDEHETIVREPSETPGVGLGFFGDTLYLYWVAPGKRITVLESRDDALTFTRRTTLDHTSLVRPALLSHAASGASQKDYYVFFSDPVNDQGPMKMITTEHANVDAFSHAFDLFPDATPRALVGATFRNQMYVAWTGTNGFNHPNVARYTPGELVTYGLLSR